MQKYRKWNNLPLQNHKFWRLWSGLLISRLGDQFTVIALLWFILQLTGSGLALASVLLCFSLPGIVTSPILGRLLDQFQPRLVMGADNLVRSLVIGAIPCLYWLGQLQLWMIYALALLAGLVAPATSVGVRVLLPDLIEDAQLEAGNAWLSATEQFSYLVGPALAGILVGVLGGPAVLLIDAISFLAMTIILYSLPNIVRKASPVITDEPLRGDTQKSQSSFRTLLGLKQVWIITSLSFVFFLSYGPLEPALPLYSQQFLKAEASGYGLLWSAFGVGAVLGLVVTPYLSKVRRSGITFASIALLWGLFLAPLTWLSDLPMAMLFLGLAGCAWAPYTTLETSILQRLIPAELRGQVFGVRATLLSASTPVGVILGGILLDFIPSNEVIGISALACILVGVAGLLSPAVRTITRRPASIALVTAERLSDPE